MKLISTFAFVFLLAGTTKANDPKAKLLPFLDAHRQLDQESCTDAPTFFATSLFVQVSGILDGSTPEEIAALEEAFLASYNEIASCTNDLDFFDLFNVEIVADTTDAIPSNITNITQDSFSSLVWLLNIDGECQGCASDVVALNVTSALRRTLSDTVRRLADDNVDKDTTMMRGGISRMLDGQVDVCCPPPLDSDVLTAYNAELDSLVAAGTVETVAEFQDLVLLEQVECSTDIVAFNATTVIAAEVDLNSATAEQLDHLGVLIADTYNALNLLTEDKCDNTFRKITNVTVDLELSAELSTRFQEAEGDAWYVQLVAQMEGECLGCDPEAPIYSTNTTSLMLDTPSAANVVLNQTVENCLCAVGAVSGTPTTLEFEIALEAAIAETSNKTDAVTFVSEVMTVYDAEPFVCSQAGLSGFEITVDVDITTEVAGLTAEETAALELALYQDYNALNAFNDAICDTTGFPVVTDVVVTSTDFASSTILNALYSGQCRGCDSAPFLFKEVRRRLDDTTVSDCFCPVAAEARLPTEAEYMASVNATLRTIIAGASVQDVYHVLFSAVEASSRPSESPTFSLSHNPSAFPTIAASSNPSVSPSPEPSKLPSVSPSWSPSIGTASPTGTLDNDLCIYARQIAARGGTLFDNTLPSRAVTHNEEANACQTAPFPTSSRGVWFVLEGNNKHWGFSTCNQATTFDAFITVFTGTCSNLECDTTTSFASPCSGNGWTLDVFAERGKTYYILVQSRDGSNGVLALSSEQFGSRPTGTPSSFPSNGPTTSPFPSISAPPSSIPSVVPTDTPSGVPSNPPSESPSIEPSVGPSNVPSHVPSESPSLNPSAVPSGVPTDTPSGSPSLEPSHAPSLVPSSMPSEVPTDTPSVIPSLAPSDSSFPSVVPSGTPSEPPSGTPSVVPSVVPSGTPSEPPSVVPSGTPSEPPSGTPSVVPSGVPSGTPSEPPSGVPSGTPSEPPSGTPSGVPSGVPSGTPSQTPSESPSVVPSGVPTNTPSGMPSQFPSVTPTI